VACTGGGARTQQRALLSAFRPGELHSAPGLLDTATHQRRVQATPRVEARRRAGGIRLPRER
jgi:hypothetical protein